MNCVNSHCEKAGGLGMLIHSDIENIRTYFRIINNMLINEMLCFEDKSINLDTNIHLTTIENICDDDYDEYWMLTEFFPNFHTKSVFVSIYSYLESKMRQLAILVEDSFPAPTALDDLSGGDFDRIREYFTKIQHLPLKSDSTFQRTNIFRKVRNIIVHNNSRLNSSKNAEAVTRFAIKNPDIISIDEFRCLHINNKCNLDFLNVVEKYLCNLVLMINTLNS